MAAISHYLCHFRVSWLPRYIVTLTIVLSWNLLSRYIVTIVSIAHPYRVLYALNASISDRFLFCHARMIHPSLDPCHPSLFRCLHGTARQNRSVSATLVQPVHDAWLSRLFRNTVRWLKWFFRRHSFKLTKSITPLFRSKSATSPQINLQQVSAGESPLSLFLLCRFPNSITATCAKMLRADFLATRQDSLPCR